MMWALFAKYPYNFFVSQWQIWIILVHCFLLLLICVVRRCTFILTISIFIRDHLCTTCCMLKTNWEKKVIVSVFFLYFIDGLFYFCTRVAWHHVFFVSVDFIGGFDTFSAYHSPAKTSHMQLQPVYVYVFVWLLRLAWCMDDNVSYPWQPSHAWSFFHMFHLCFLQFVCGFACFYISITSVVIVMFRNNHILFVCKLLHHVFLLHSFDVSLPIMKFRFIMFLYLLNKIFLWNSLISY